MSVGLGLRREMLAELDGHLPSCVDFWEIAPENWMSLGGKYSEILHRMTSQAPFYCHGLSLSIGSSDPLDSDFVTDVKRFLEKHSIVQYSEHLSYCSDHGHVYDLLPIPFTRAAVKHTVDRIKRVQDILQRPLVIENASYYCALGQEMSELEFTLSVLEASNCEMLLDVNNVYVNSVNHNYDAKQFIQALPSNKLRYLHVAGHYEEAPDLLVDTHGTAVTNNVWRLLADTYQCHGVLPTLLERDFNIPPMTELLQELQMIRSLQANYVG